MKLFIQTQFYQFVSPFIYQLIPTHPARYFWTRILLAFLLSRGLEWIIDLTEPILGEPIDDTWQYYLYLILETIRYGCWFWSIWYGLVQTINFTLHPQPKLSICILIVAIVARLLPQMTRVRDHLVRLPKYVSSKLIALQL